MKKAKIGLIVPPKDGGVPPEAQAIYGSQIEFVSYGLGIEQMTEADFANALENLEGAVKTLLDQGVDAISVMGTSLTFFRGRRGNENIIKRLQQSAPKIPVSTMSNAIIGSLERVGARKIALFSAYDQDMNQRLISFLEEHGIVVTHTTNLDLLDIADVHKFSQQALTELVDEAISEAKADSDALVISCGGLRTLEIRNKHDDFPIISSAVDGIEDVTSLVL